MNVLLHAADAVLLWRVLILLRVPGAWLGACLFALHPVEVESVAWITERKNVLSCFFYLGAVLAWFRFEGGRTARRAVSTAAEGSGRLVRRPGRDWRFYGVAVACFVCALGTKTVTCSLPAALLLIILWKGGPRRAGDWRSDGGRSFISTAAPLIPLFLIGAGMGLLTAWMERHYVGEQTHAWAFSFAQRILVAGRALLFYTGKLLLPARLTFIYPHWEVDANRWRQWLFPAGALAATLGLWGLRKRFGAGPLVAWLFYGLTLFPALGFFYVFPFRYSFVADHFQYLASMGPLALAGAGMARASEYFGKALQTWSRAGCAAIFLLLGTLTWLQCGMYEDLETLYRTTIARNPGCWMAYDNLAVVLMNRGNVDEAMGLSRKTLAIKPDNPQGHVNLGNALVAQHRMDEAIGRYREAIRYSPQMAEAHSDLGNIFLFQGHAEGAMAEYQTAIKIKPGYAEAHNNLGYAEMQKGRLEEATAEFRKALELKPDYPQARANLDNALLKTRQGEQK